MSELNHRYTLNTSSSTSKTSTREIFLLATMYIFYIFSFACSLKLFFIFFIIRNKIYKNDWINWMVWSTFPVSSIFFHLIGPEDQAVTSISSLSSAMHVASHVPSLSCRNGAYRHLPFFSMVTRAVTSSSISLCEGEVVSSRVHLEAFTPSLPASKSPS